jgi:hypothetical protein
MNVSDEFACFILVLTGRAVLKLYPLLSFECFGHFTEQH